MYPEHCPFHRTDDLCLPVARILAEQGLITPAPAAPAVRSLTPELPPLPSGEELLATIAHRIDVWGRVVIDPTLPAAGQDRPHDERQLRFMVQALSETVATAPAREQSMDWWTVGQALRDAQSAAQHSTLAQDEAGRRLWWYLAARHLEHAEQTWRAHIGRPLSGAA